MSAKASKAHGVDEGEDWSFECEKEHDDDEECVPLVVHGEYAEDDGTDIEEKELVAWFDKESKDDSKEASSCKGAVGDRQFVRRVNRRIDVGGDEHVEVCRDGFLRSNVAPLGEYSQTKSYPNDSNASYFGQVC